MKKLLLAALLTGVSAAPAYSQGVVNPAFTGPRIEGLIGLDRIRSEGEVGEIESENGLLYGAGVGYDIALGRAVIGAEAELTKSDVDQCFNMDGDEACVGTDRDIYLGVRAGFLASPEAMVYAKAGYTSTSTTIEVNGEEIDRDDLGFELAEYEGLRLGAGAEFLIGTNAYLKTEYRYSNYEDDVTRHQAVLGLGFRF